MSASLPVPSTSTIATAMLAALLALAVAPPVVNAAGAAAFDSEYTTVNDKARCQFKEEPSQNGEPESCRFLCDGPLPGLKTLLLSCHDWEHLYFHTDGKWYSTWSAMTKVGGFSGIGNKKGLVEWVFDARRPRTRHALQGLIVRFQGVKGDGETTGNALSVFSLREGDICWIGNYADNVSARAALGEAECREPLTPEEKDPT